MKDDDRFTLKNDEYDTDARAVKESELLPIYEAMDFSGDIQPLEDFETPEPTAFDLNRKRKSEGKASEKKDIKKKKIPLKKGSNKFKKALVAALSVILVVGVVIFAGYMITSGQRNPDPVQMIYSTENATFLKLGGDERFKLDGAEKVKVSDDGTKVFYCVPTKSKVGKYDIKYIDVSKKSSLKKGGVTLCHGVDDGWSMSLNGSYLCYSTTVSSVKQCFFYSTEENKEKQLPVGVEEMFLPSTGDVIYFTRKSGSLYSLHRLKYDDMVENVAGEITHIKFCDSDEGFEVIYTVKSTETDGAYDVYTVRNLEKPSRICSDISEISLDTYTYGGNLYYFKNNTSTVDWHDFVDDPYYESDMTLKRPAENDYMIEYGFIIKRYILDKNAYNAAVSKYEKKLKRDQIREELDRIDFGLALSGDYTCNVYNHYTNKILATGVSLENILAVSADGIPRMIFRKAAINVDKKFSMNELVKYAERLSAGQAGDYVRENVKRSYEASEECVYSWYDGNKAVTKVITDYKNKDTEFYLTSGLSFYAANRGNLYLSKIENQGIKKCIHVAEGVTDIEVVGDKAYYNRDNDSDGYDLFRYYEPDGEQKLTDNIVDFIPLSDDRVVLFSSDENSRTITVGGFSGDKYSAIAADIVMDHFIHNGNTIAFIVRDPDSSVANSGTLYVCRIGESAIECENGITDIKYIKENTDKGNKK